MRCDKVSMRSSQRLIEARDPSQQPAQRHPAVLTAGGAV